MTQQRIYSWEIADFGDAAPPQVVEVTPESIVEYCRAARYESLVYTNQSAAREAGFPDIVAPPAMLLALAPARLEEVAAAKGCVLPSPPEGSSTIAPPVRLNIQFQGSMAVPGDVVSSGTFVEDKFESEKGRFLTFRVRAHNQRGDPVVDYCLTFLWSENKDS